MSANVYYYLQGSTLLDELEKHLIRVGAKELQPDSGMQIEGNFENSWALIHKSMAGDVRNFIPRFKLVIYFSGGATGCDKEKKSDLAVNPNGLYWLASAQTLVDGFDALFKYVNGNLASPEKLNPDGWLVQQPITLTALSILCQGYLIVRANQEGNVSEDLKPWVSEQWPNLSNRKAEVQQHEYWNVFDGMDTKELNLVVEEEWKGLRGDGDLDHIKHLIQTLPTKEKPLKDTDTPMVAHAYKAIAARFGARRG